MFRTGEGEAEGRPFFFRLGTLYETHSTSSPGSEEASGLSAAAIALREGRRRWHPGRQGGANTLSGGGGGDVLFHGTTRSDASWAQLLTIQVDWLRTDLAAAGRIAHLRSGGGLNGGVKLNATTVLDDAFRDLLRGGAGADWLWRRLPPGVADALLDRAAEDFVN